MEEITVNKLMSDFDAVLTQLNDIVANSKSTDPAIKQKAKEDAVTALSQIKRLVEGKEKVAVDDLGSYKGADKDNYDTILHVLLDKMTGDVELEQSELTTRKTNLENEKNTKVADYKTNNPTWATDTVKKAELEELEAKYDNEIAVLQGYLDEMSTKSVTTLKVDLKADFAKKVGEDIFRAYGIRKTLLDRAKKGADRSEILAIYENGIRNIEAKQTAVKAEHDKYYDQLSAILINGSDNEYDQAREAQNESRESDAIAHYENIRQRAITKANELSANGDNELLDLLTTEGFENPATPIADMAKAKDFEKKVIKIYRDKVKKLQDEYNELVNDSVILENERGLLQKEIEAIKLDIDSPEVQAERDLREQQIRASMHGDEAFETQWNDTVLRFCRSRDNENTNNKLSYNTTLPSNGSNVQIEFKTIDIANYEGGEAQYNKDIEFLNLNEYKKFFELTSAYESISNATQEASDRYILMKEFMAQLDYEKYKQIEDIEQNDSAENAYAIMNEYLSQGKEYIDTYNGFTNEAGVKYSTLKTAGSTLKAMLPVSGNLPAKQKVGNAFSNVARFLGLRMPKFNKIDENGNSVRDIKGGLLTLATDVAVIGGAAATTIVGGPLALAGTYGVAYAAKGAVTAGNRVAARAHYKKHKYEIDNNLPTLGRATKSDKEVARRDYYRQVEGRGAFSSWLRAKNEKVFSIFSNRARETEDKICDRSVQLAHTSINRRVTFNKAIAEQNQIARENNIKITARDAFTYNDLVSDSKAIFNASVRDKEVAFKAAVQNSALRSRGLNPKFRIVDSKNPINDKYIRNSEDAFGVINDFKLKGDSSSVNAFTVEQKYRAQQEHVDRWNRFWTAALTLGGRLSFDFAKTRFLEQQTRNVQGPSTRTEDQIIPAHDEIQKVAVQKDVVGGDFSKSVSDLSYGDDVYMHTFGAPVNSTSHLAKGSSIDGFAISYVKDGQQYGVSIGESASGFTHEHVQTLLGQGENLSNMSMMDAVKKMISNNPDGWKAYMDAKGIPSNTKLEDVLVKAIKDGDVYGQSGVTGWRHLGENNLVTKKVTEYVEKTVHIPEKIIPGKVIPGQTQTITTDAFSAKLAGISALKGAAPGVGVAVGEGLHETANKTKKERSGRFEDKNRLLNPDKYIEDDDLTL